MINCPNCGNPVSQGQRFCGSCGTDVHAALGASAHAAPVTEGQAAPYAYTQPTGYGYEPQPAAEQPAAGRFIIIGGVLILAVCCAFACGLLFGFEIIPTLFGAGGATPRPPTRTPTPTSLLPILYYLFA